MVAVSLKKRAGADARPVKSGNPPHDGEAEAGPLTRFHAAHKYLLMAHSQKHYREMGRLVAKGKQVKPSELYGRYETLLNDALSLKGTISKHTNVLMHIMGYFKKQLSGDEKQELLEVFGQYRQEFVPLVVPITLINHFVRKYDQQYLKMQTYLNPHPVELKLRTHV